MKGFNTKIKVAFAYSLLYAAFINTSAAQEDNDPYIPPSAYSYNYGEMNNVQTNVTTLTSDLMGDSIDPNTGTVSFTHTDVSIPGNFNIPVMIQRTMSDPDSWYKESLELGNWSLAIPHVRGTYITPSADNFVHQTGPHSPWKLGKACSTTVRPSFFTFIESLSGTWRRYETSSADYSGIRTISIPGKGSAQITMRNGELLNNKNWKVDCLNEGSYSEGFLVTTTDGTKYSFTHKREIKSRKDHYLARFEWSCESGGQTYCQFPSEAPGDPSINPLGPLPKNPKARMDNIHAFLQVTEIEDRYGNKVNYIYDSNGELDKIVASDGRLIDLTFTGARLTTVTANGRTWGYEYDLGGAQSPDMLVKVTQPDNRTWEYEYNSSTGIDFWSLNGQHSQTDPLSPYYCQGFGFGNLVTITHPSKVRGEFKLKERCMGKAEVPKVENFNPYGQGALFQSYLLPIHVQIFSIHSKKLTFVDGEEYEWNYEYARNGGYFIGDNVNTQGRNMLVPFGLINPVYIPLHPSDKPEHMNATFLKHPDGSVDVKYFDRRYGFTDGQLRYSATFDSEGNALMSKRLEYHNVVHCQANTAFRKYGYSGQMTPSLINFPEFVKTTPCAGWVSFEQGHGAIENQKVAKTTTTYYDGANNSTYTEEVDDYNTYDVPRSFKQSSDNATRFIKKTFRHDTGRWLLNLPAKVYVSDSEFNDENNGTLLSEMLYYSPNHHSYPSMPFQEKWLGQLRKTFKTYHIGSGSTGKKGKVKKVEMDVDDSIKRWVSFDDYKRGQTTLVTVPARYDNGTMSLSKVVDDNGWVTRTTDFNGTHTYYGYDDAGDISYVDYTNDASAGVNWSDLRFTWDNAYEPKRTVEHCELNAARTSCSSTKLRVTEFYDGFYRLKKSQSADLVGGNTRYQRFEYNHRNQTTFTSQVSTSQNEMKGTTVEFDALGRLISSSSSGLGTVYEEYLGNNTKRVTDGRGNQTTTSYLAYGAPSYQNALVIDSPENVTTSLSYDIFGNVRTITQAGLGKNGQSVSQTEYRSYDANNNLCLTVRSDVGATAFKHNAMGEMEWQAQGVSYNTSTRACIAKPTSLAVDMTYDNLGTLWKVEYPDATPDVVHVRDKNGNVIALTAGNVLQNYEYNNQNLLTKETVRIPGKSAYVFKHDYSAQKFPAKLTYPDGMAVSFSPNGFGQSTTAEIPPVSGSLPYKFAHNVKYYPNGQMQSFTYGNGIEHTQLQFNDAKLPSAVIHKKGSTDIVRLNYTYDDNANVKSITDGVNSAYSLTNMQYDGLDRLTSTTGGTGIGSSVMKYDSFGNITYYKSKDRINHYNYSYTNNRLTAVASSGAKQKDYTSFTYDARGNITNNSHQSMEYNLANQMTSAKGTNTYLYDGFNRRVKQTDAKGTSYSVYSQSGTLLMRDTNSGKINYIYLAGKLISKVGISESPDSSNQHYAPFGSVIEGEKDGVGYTGHKFDTDIGLSYMQARYYDPVIGRFYSNDPVGFRAVHSFNRYAYVNNNPYSYNDPTGMTMECVTDDDGNETCTTTAKSPTKSFGQGIKSYFQGVSNYVRHESRMLGYEGAGQSAQANFVEKELLGLALQLGKQATLDDLGLVMDQVDGFAVAGRFASSAFVKDKVGGSIGVSFSVLAAAGDAYKAIEDIAVEFNLNVGTVDINTPILQQVPDPLVRERIKTKLTEVGARMFDGAH
ncbi:MAG: RHS repeat-associated core domain-containing protein [Glaciecola sp.]|jgi:RHS repeat-associated protein